MQGTDNAIVREMSLTFVRSQLASAQSLEVVVEHLIEAIVASGHSGEICEILEDIANVYMNMSERVAEARVGFAQARTRTDSGLSKDFVVCALSASGLELELSNTGRPVKKTGQMSKV